jgi:hypothetical protein
MGRHDNDPIEITAEIIHETDAALLLNDGTGETWVPKSQISYPDGAGAGDTVEVTMPEWLAQDRGFI